MGLVGAGFNKPCRLSYLCPAAFLAQSVCLDDTTVKFEIWDTAGQERYHSLAPMYYRGAQAAIVVFDITKPVQYTQMTNQLLIYKAVKNDWLVND